MRVLFLSLLSRLRRPQTQEFDVLSLPNGRTMRFIRSRNSVISARRIDADGNETEEVEYYFLHRPGGGIFRLTKAQVESLTFEGQPSNTAALLSLETDLAYPA